MLSSWERFSRFVGKVGAHYYFMGDIILSCCFGGGFSETGVAFQGGFWTLIVLGSYIFAHRSSWRFRAPLFLSAMIWLGTLVALVLLALSPVVKARLMDLPSPPNLLALLEMCFRYAAIFTLKTMKQVYENVVILAFFFFFGFYSATHHSLRVTTLRLLPWKLFLVVGVEYYYCFAVWLPLLMLSQVIQS